MGKKRAWVTCCACKKWDWRSSVGPCCKFCGASYDKGNSERVDQADTPKGSSEDPKVGSKPAKGFRWITQEIVELVDEGRARELLKGLELNNTKEALLDFATYVPALKAAAEALAELRWPTTTPVKGLERDLQSAQTAKRTAERAKLTAEGQLDKAREALRQAEAADRLAGEKVDEAQAKVTDLICQLKNAVKPEEPRDRDEFMDASDGSTPDPAAIHLEARLGKVAKLRDFFTSRRKRQQLTSVVWARSRPWARARVGQGRRAAAGG